MIAWLVTVEEYDRYRPVAVFDNVGAAQLYANAYNQEHDREPPDDPFAYLVEKIPHNPPIGNWRKQ